MILETKLDVNVDEQLYLNCECLSKNYFNFQKISSFPTYKIKFQFFI